MHSFPTPKLPITCGEYEIKSKLDKVGLKGLYLAENPHKPGKLYVAIFFYLKNLENMTALMNLLSANPVFEDFDVKKCSTVDEDNKKLSQWVYCIVFDHCDGGLQEVISPSVFENGHAILPITNQIMPIKTGVLEIIKKAIVEQVNTLANLGYGIVDPTLSDFIIVINKRGELSVLFYNTLKLTEISTFSDDRKVTEKLTTQEILRFTESLKPVTEAFYRYAQGLEFVLSRSHL